ncbi:MAG: CcmD family protein [Deltaproteobacteria bacterium]|nr:CcmD family protein [Deltaproteobacteria bacterium]MDZ4224411.1 CcmD family protein [bacterium]
MTGVIQGAEGYLTAAYALTWIVIAGYGFCLFTRWKKICKKN